MTSTSLIETWMPIAAIGEESVRERRFSMAGNVLPPNNSLHVWWARRPLIASRAAVLASILPADFDQKEFLALLGIKGDPVTARQNNDRAIRRGDTPLGDKEYGYPRAFKNKLSKQEIKRISEAVPSGVTLLDPTAGGGSIPFESMRLNFFTHANDLNPVAALIQKGTIEYPLRYGHKVVDEFRKISKIFNERISRKLEGIFPPEGNDTLITGYLWARTVKCHYCDGLVPLSPNWKLSSKGVGVRLIPRCEDTNNPRGRYCEFKIVHTAREHSSGTVSRGDVVCPFPDCGRVMDDDQVRAVAQAGEMGEQLYAIAYKRRVTTFTKSGARGRDRWERGYRSACSSDDNSADVTRRLSAKIEDWEALGYWPTESVESAHPKYDPRRWGMCKWTDFFSERQIYCHVSSVELFHEMLDEETHRGLSDVTRAAFVYLSFAIDKMVNWNARLSSWNVRTETLRSVFDRHDFSFKWSFAEIPAAITGGGYEWAIGQVANCLEDICDLIASDSEDLLRHGDNVEISADNFSLSCLSGDGLPHIQDKSVDVIVVDPPYYDNVMYAELSDFFYVWLKRTAGVLVPELFTRKLTDKENEAVANPTKFDGAKGAMLLAGRDYKERMARIFEECQRVLKRDGVMTLMFTHKAAGAWDALTKGLMESGFSISASWPVNTEAEGSLHIKDKSAANSTILLVCRPRDVRVPTDEVLYWEDVEPLVAKAVRSRVSEFQAGGISGVDLYLASFGPALQEFSRHWPLKRGRPRARPDAQRRQKQAVLFEEEYDPYAVTPEDALEAARREVKRWRLEQLTRLRADTEVDPLTSWFVLAWDAFRAPVFPYDEALRLARAVGVDLDTQVVGVLAEKKGSDLLIWDSTRRAAKGALGSPDGSRAMIDAVHHAANITRTRTLQAAADMLAKAQIDKEPTFLAALEAVLEVLPVSKQFSGIDLDGDVALASSDFETLENLRKFAFAGQVDEPKQLDLWRMDEVA